VSLAGQTAVQLHVATLMSPKELAATGVAGLSPIQRAALDQWLTGYTTLMRKVFATSTNDPAYVTGSGHSVDEVCGDGSIVLLDDGSIWLIEDTDRVDTSLWLSTTDITVSRNPRPIGDYKFILNNTEDHEKASAKYLGNN
jgi:hypothetical protein